VADPNPERIVLLRLLPLMAMSVLGFQRPIASTTRLPVPVREVELRGHLGDARRIDAEIRVLLATPFGRIPVTGHVRGAYQCDATFRGDISYGPIIRLIARIRRFDLVSELDGRVNPGEEWRCELMPADSVRGAATIEETRLSGWIRIGEDSIPFNGPSWSVGDSTYHSDLQVRRGARLLDARVNVYERGRK
jgi:hypothetical protein